MEMDHPGIAVNFCYNRSGGNAGGLGVALDHCFLRKQPVEACFAIDKNEVGSVAEGKKGAFHRKAGSLINIDAVDFFFTADADSGKTILKDFAEKTFSLYRFELFGIVEIFEAVSPEKDNSCGNNRPGQWAAADFIHSGRAGTSCHFGIKLYKP